MVMTATAALTLGCPKGEEKAKPAPKEEPAKVKPAETAPAAQGASPTSDPDCIGAWSVEGAAEKKELAGRSYEITGAKLREVSTDADDRAVLGVIAGIKEDTPENLAVVSQMVAFFKEKQVEAIVVDGDIGDTEQQIDRVLEPLGATGLPVFVLIGNQERKAFYNNGVKAAAMRHPGIVDMGKVRLAMLDDVAIVSMPGYYNKSYIHVEDGCLYQPSDVQATRAVLQAATGKPIVLVSHGPPRQNGPEAIDWTSEQVNVGDPELTKLIRENGVRFGIFANIREAGGHATNLDGTSVVGEGKLAPELFLNPGLADAVGWKMNDRTESNGMAAVLTVQGGQAMFEIKRMPAAK